MTLKLLQAVPDAAKPNYHMFSPTDDVLHYLFDFPKAEAHKEHIKAAVPFTKLLKGKQDIPKSDIGLLPTEHLDYAA